MTLGGGGDSVAPAPAVPTAVPVAVLADDPHLEYAEVAPRLEFDDGEDGDSGSGSGDGALAASVETAASSSGSGRGAHAAPGVRATGVWLVVLGVTVVMGFADALVVGKTQLGWLTGVSLLAASVYGALVVRREDAIIAVIAPPLAFFLATITAGQLTLPPTGDLLVREAFMIVTTLGANAPWIFGSTIAALVIVLVRRRRSAPATPSPQP